MKKIALGQMNIKYGHFQENCKTAFNFIDSALQQNCDLILLPELWSSGFDYSNRYDHSSKNVELLKQLQNQCDLHQISIGGTYIEYNDGNYYNSAVLLRPLQAPYRYYKIHLFNRMHENLYFAAGSVNEPDITVMGSSALSVCYDLRFPELFVSQSTSGAESFFLMAHWPLSRIHHWDILLQARAIENQAFMLAVNSCGLSGKDIYGGHSSIIGPEGEIILQGSTDEELLVAEIDPSSPSRIRREFEMKR